MPSTFTPHKPDVEVVVKIRKREAVLIQKLRKYAFGKFVVQKIAGNIIRVEINDSQAIEEDEELILS